MAIAATTRPNASRHLIVVLKTQAAPTLGAAHGSLNPILEKYGATLASVRQEDGGALVRPGLLREASAPLDAFYHVKAQDKDLEPLRDEILASGAAAGAYIKLPGAPPVVAARAWRATPAPSPDFSVRQGYLGPAPAGVDAYHAWSIAGGAGAGVSIIDCEWAWNFTHEDLSRNGGVVIGQPSGDDDHGTAVLGEIVGASNGFGVAGIAPDASLSTAAFDDYSDQPTSTVIAQAASRLSAGDIILLEIHRPGPRSDSSGSQFGYLPVEWWPDDFHAILEATRKGILVVEAAGNGSQDLADTVYDQPDTGFPQGWTNPFNGGNPQSGAILVGAGNPPAGTHGRSQDTLGFQESYVDRARCAYSNYGARVDCQGWGWEVTSTGYGDLSGRGIADRNRFYTDVFAGTSSASPIVTGTLACLQGILKASRRKTLTPSQAQSLLRTTGSPQQAAPGRPANQNIGNRPDLKQLIEAVAAAAPPGVPHARVPAVPAVPAAPTERRPRDRKARAATTILALAVAGLVASCIGMTWLGGAIPRFAATPVAAWLFNLAFIALLFAGIGLRQEATWLGVAIDSRNRLSLSRLQIVAWTSLLAATLLVVFLWNVSHHAPGEAWNATDKGIDLSIPPTVWLLMGMSGISAVASPFILNGKPASAPAGSPLPPPAMTADGVVLRRPAGAQISWADIIMGDELGNAGPWTLESCNSSFSAPSRCSSMAPRSHRLYRVRRDAKSRRFRR